MKLFKFDQGASLQEKIVTVAVPLIVLILLGWLYGSVWGIFTNDLSVAAATASAGWHTLGTVLLLASVVVFAAEWFEFTPIKSTIASVIIWGTLIVLSILAYCGFFVGVY